MDLAEIRKRKGLTQEEMAKSLGITRPAYTNIEARKRKPSVKIARKIGVILDIEWPMLFEEHTEKSKEASA